MLLHGVTGGGKTEVYMQVIKDVIARGKEAVVLVPEISLTPQMVERFKGRFPGNVAVFHSRLSEGERQDQWRRVKDQKVSIAVGARSAVFAPFKDIGIIIIDEEHESSYKSESTPRYHAAEIAAERCKRNGALLLYGSATPSVERYYSAKSGKIELLTIYKRTNFLDLPVVDVVDLRDELKSGNRKMFSRKLIIEIEKNIQNGEQTILFLNRRGYSPFVLCRSCGYIVTCKNCSVSYTYHSDTEKLICHYCGAAARLPGKCPVCESLDIKLFGAGTQRVEEEVKKLFNGCSVIRMDRDTTSAKNSHERILNEFVKKKIDILIGTQMIAKGHDFPNVTLVGVLAADPMLNINDFRSAERAFQLLMQVSGRAGRGKIRGRVVIQTYNPDHYSIATSMEHDYNSFYRQEIMVRRELEYPPFKSIGAVMLSGPDDKKTFDAALTLHTKCREEHSGDDGIVITKPLRPPIGVIKDKYRWRFIIKHGDTNKLAQILGELGDFFFSGKLPKDAELGVDINPNSMM
jgi:primosomal protein N' (replication factor Y)